MKKILSLMIIVGLVVLSCPIPIAKADDATSSASVANAVPVSSSVSIDSGADNVYLTENTTTNVVVTATVTDNNGYEDIDSVSAKLFKTTTGAGAGDDPLNHYTEASCTPSGGSGLTETYTCTFAVQYYADATDTGAYSADTWSAEVTPTDGTGGTAGTNDTVEMATLTALDVTSTIAYGELALSGVTADTTAFDTTVTNTGNQATIGVQVDGYGASNGDGYAMTCTVGNIPLANEKYHETSTTAYASKAVLTDTAATATSVSAAKGASANTDTIGWGLQMPATGVSGSCTGTVVFTAV